MSTQSPYLRYFYIALASFRTLGSGLESPAENLTLSAGVFKFAFAIFL